MSKVLIALTCALLCASSAHATKSETWASGDIVVGYLLTPSTTPPSHGRPWHTDVGAGEFCTLLTPGTPPLWNASCASLWEGNQPTTKIIGEVPAEPSDDGSNLSHTKVTFVDRINDVSVGQQLDFIEREGDGPIVRHSESVGAIASFTVADHVYYMLHMERGLWTSRYMIDTGYLDGVNSEAHIVYQRPDNSDEIKEDDITRAYQVYEGLSAVGQRDETQYGYFWMKNGDLITTAEVYHPVQTAGDHHVGDSIIFHERNGQCNDPAVVTVTELRATHDGQWIFKFAGAPSWRSQTDSPMTPFSRVMSLRLGDEIRNGYVYPADPNHPTPGAVRVVGIVDEWPQYDQALMLDSNGLFQIANKPYNSNEVYVTPYIQCPRHSH